MSEPSESGGPDTGPDADQLADVQAGDAATQTEPAELAEEIDGLPVLGVDPTVVRAYSLADGLPSRRRAPVVIPAAAAAAVAAGGFVAGAAVVGLVARRQRRSSALAKGRRVGREIGRGGRGGRAGRGAGRAGELVQIVGSRSLLLDVHLLGGGED